MYDVGSAGWRQRLRAGLCLAGLVLAAVNAAADCQPSAEAPPVCLAGTVIDGDGGVALVAEPGSPALTELRAGDSVVGWAVAEIGQRYIVLRQDRSSVRLDLDTAAPTMMAEPPPPVPKIAVHRHVSTLQDGDDGYAK